jgi:K+-transporting ATPase KdpF subunit
MPPNHYEFNLRGSGRRVLRGLRPLRPLLRETVGGTMETMIAGLIALLLFAYLVVAMLYPEKF